jgi:hypothetical protein
MREISVVAKASAARDFFAYFFGLSKKEENWKALHSTLFSMRKETGCSLFLFFSVTFS